MTDKMPVAFVMCMEKMQIPPLRCGMTSKGMTSKGMTSEKAGCLRDVHGENADSSASLRNDKQRNYERKMQVDCGMGMEKMQIPPLRCGMTTKG